MIPRDVEQGGKELWVEDCGSSSSRDSPFGMESTLNQKPNGAF